tara:strand:- start:6424 stop:7347 length:924 start_codon:yes stop_codon:yes gene_type:complete
MKNFLEPDKTWELFGIHSQEQFLNSFVTIGKFHEKVPEEIVLDYEIVERLQFYSYYKYALVDDAFARATKIFEAGVNLKIRSLKLEKEKGFESLNTKIKKLENFTSYELYKQWNHSREIRNIFAHHESNRLFGSTLLSSFVYFVNMINTLFLEKSQVLKHEKTLKELQNDTIKFEKGLFVMKYKEKKILIWSCIPYTISTNIKKNISLWCFHPVYKVNKLSNLNDFSPPIILSLVNVIIDNDILKGNCIISKNEIEIQSTNKTENMFQYEIYNQTMLNAKTELKQLYWTVLEKKIANEVSKFLYQNW